MAYLIQRNEAVDAEVRRILLEQNRRALALLEGWREDPRERIHQARQAFKRARALLRLFRPGARYVYRVENAFYRDLGRGLSFARDTDAVIDALGLLESRIAGPLARESLRMFRLALEQRARREREGTGTDLPGHIRSACDALAAAERRFRDLPLAELRRKDLRRGVEATMERCSLAFERASHTQAADDFHTWRKHVKFAYHQSRLLQETAPRWSREAGPVLDQLADELGHHHDMVMLEALLQTQSDELNVDVHLRSMRNGVRAARAEFAAAALRCGSGLFGAGGSQGVLDVEFGAPA